MSLTASPNTVPAQVSAPARPLLRSPAFIITAAVLLAAAIGLNGAANMMKLNFRKLPVDLQAPLNSLPKQFGPWLQVSIDNPLSHDTEEVLGTKQYIFRDYVNTTKVPAARMAEFEGKDWEARQQLAWTLQREYPTAVIRMSVTYYTGMVDTVAHIPDRCFVADGFIPTVYEVPHWKLPGSPVDSEGRRLDAAGHRITEPSDTKTHEDVGLPVRFINFEDQDNRYKSSTRNVTYFFQVNGRYANDPIEVRKTLQNLFERYGYYSKVELMTLLSDKDLSAGVKRDFLQHALPELEKSLPDWKSVVTNAGAAARPATQPAATP